MKIALKTGMASALLIAASCSQAQDHGSDPLRAMTRCFSGGEFHAESTERRTAASPFRTVDTTAGPRQVSVADGYRLMIYRSSKQPLVNLKIERSMEGKFDDDRAAIMLQLARLADSSKPPNAVIVEHSTQNGIAIAALNNRAIGTPGVVSMLQLFDAASGTIATAYILNQAPAVREYADEDTYRVLRDRFIGTLSACMAHAPQ
jgi:hypothetical protein